MFKLSCYKKNTKRKKKQKLSFYTLRKLSKTSLETNYLGRPNNKQKRKLPPCQKRHMATWRQTLLLKIATHFKYHLTFPRPMRATQGNSRCQNLSLKRQSSRHVRLSRRPTSNSKLTSHSISKKKTSVNIRTDSSLISLKHMPLSLSTTVNNRRAATELKKLIIQSFITVDAATPIVEPLIS